MSFFLLSCQWTFKPWKTVTIRASQLLEEVNAWTMSLPFVCKLTNSELPQTLLQGSCTLGQYSCELTTPGSSTRQLRTAARPQSLLRLFRLPGPKLLPLPQSLFLPPKPQHIFLCLPHIFLWLPLSLDNPASQEVGKRV